MRVDQQPIHDVRATLLSLHSMVTGRQVVVDLGARLEIAALAAEFRTGYAATDLDDHNGLKTCERGIDDAGLPAARCRRHPQPRRHRQSLPLMDDDRVAVVIGQSVMADDDSAEHGPNGLHELTFERETLNPALGARGAAILSESGALIRRAAIDSVEVGDEEPIEAAGPLVDGADDAGMESGRCCRRSGVVRQVVHSQDAVYERRVLQARALAHDDLRRRTGSCGLNSLRLGQRLADRRVGGSSAVGLAAQPDSSPSSSARC